MNPRWDEQQIRVAYNIARRGTPGSDEGVLADLLDELRVRFGDDHCCEDARWAQDRLYRINSLWQRVNEAEAEITTLRGALAAERARLATSEAMCSRLEALIQSAMTSHDGNAA